MVLLFPWKWTLEQSVPGSKDTTGSIWLYRHGLCGGGQESRGKLVCTCYTRLLYLTKWMEVYALQDRKAQAVAKCLQDLVCQSKVQIGMYEKLLKIQSKNTDSCWSVSSYTEGTDLNNIKSVTYSSIFKNPHDYCINVICLLTLTDFFSGISSGTILLIQILHFLPDTLHRQLMERNA